jgi:hypothetical protein
VDRLVRPHRLRVANDYLSWHKLFTTTLSISAQGHTGQTSSPAHAYPHLGHAQHRQHHVTVTFNSLFFNLATSYITVHCPATVLRHLCNISSINVSNRPSRSQIAETLAFGCSIETNWELLILLDVMRCNVDTRYPDPLHVAAAMFTTPPSYSFSFRLWISNIGARSRRRASSPPASRHSDK